MKPLEILSVLASSAGGTPALPGTPDEILDSPAFAMPCRLGDESVLLRRASVEPAESEMLSLSVAFGDEEHLLCVARSPRFPELEKLWDVRADVPEPVLLALVEKECGPLFQLLENAVRKQLRLVGLEDVSRRGAESNVANWELASGTGNNGDILRFSLSRTPAVVSALGVLRNLDLAHEAIRSQALPAEIEYAAFQLPDADLASLAPGDAVLLPEIGTVAPRLVACGRFVVDGHGVAPYQEDAMCRVHAATECTAAVGDLFDAAEGDRGAANVANAGMEIGTGNNGNILQLRLLRNGKTLATGRLDRLGDSPAFVVETTNNH